MKSSQQTIYLSQYVVCCDVLYDLIIIVTVLQSYRVLGQLLLLWECSLYCTVGIARIMSFHTLLDYTFSQ